jgi:Family of unknown function (DUF6527)
MAKVKTTEASLEVRLPWRVWLPRRRYRVVVTVGAADLVPHRLPRRGLVMVDGGRGPSWLAFDCPCSNRHRLLLSLNVSHRPHWRLDNPARPSLHPSIDSHDGGRRCHFWLSDGRIRWVREIDEIRSR